ncbi:hypothetical protein PV04_03405 [Phialophora macrospora]|uniref:Heterokaryon incompatibility domain-containing protein n=1 Tax=Phialophora macrospora TaxID=1851006 RepID=A0A0D2FXL7_9EURO|nr:hypothetical protein PV04_03405 [Phialophora macrospora]
MKNFEYRELLTEDRIRILELLPGAEDDAIRCNLTSELRQDTITGYDAISYTWGTSTRRAEIICCDEILSVTTNLAGALLEIRRKSPDISCRLWVDGICINQERSEEKNHQVKRLSEVYRDAKHVFVWLGPDADGIAKDCFDFLEEWTRHLDEQLRIRKSIDKIPSLEPPPHLRISEEQGSKLSRLLQCSWFSRVWVLQEAGLAKVCQLLWGKHSMDLAVLIELACFCDGRTVISRLMGCDDSALQLWRIVFLCVFVKYDNAESWRCSMPLIQSLHEKNHRRPGLYLDILQIGRSFSAKETCDHIYAFYGNPLARSPDGKLLLEPDYDKDEREVEFDAALAFLKREHDAPYVLCFVQHSSADEITGSNGPSWIPKWRNPQTDPTPLFTIGNIGLQFTAGGDVDRLQYLVDIGARLLSLQGFIFDHLTWTSEVLRTDNFALNPTQWDSELRTSQQTYIDKLWTEVSLASKHRSNLTKVPKTALIDDDFSYTLVTAYNNPLVVESAEHRKRFSIYRQALETAGREGRSGAALLSGKQTHRASLYERNTRRCRDRRLALTELGRFA